MSLATGVMMLFGLGCSEPHPTKTELAVSPNPPVISETQPRAQPKAESIAEGTPQTTLEPKPDPSLEPKPDPQSEPQPAVEPKVDPKSDPLPPQAKQTVEHEIWKITFYNEEFSSTLKPYLNPMGAMSGDIEGITAFARIGDQALKAENEVERSKLKQRMDCLVRGCVAHGTGAATDVYQPMLQALKTDDFAEFNRLANRVNALLLWNNAMDNGMSVDDLSTMAKFLEPIDKAKTASDQKGPLVKLQTFLDEFMKKQK